MKLIINKKEELEHIKEKSSYNNNFYKLKGNLNFELLEIYNDDSSCDYYIVSGKEKLCIGSSNDIGNKIEIDFGVKYT